MPNDQGNALLRWPTTVRRPYAAHVPHRDLPAVTRGDFDAARAE